MYQTMNQSLPPQWREVLPTFKQLALLKRLGCSRTPATKAEAYRLINETFSQIDDDHRRNWQWVWQ